MSIEAFFPDFNELQSAGFAGVECRKPVIMIAMTARTGSTQLCAWLEAAGDTGPITEIFNPRGVVEAEKHRRGAAGFADYMRSFNAQPGMVFCFKTNWMDFLPVTAHYRQLFPALRVIYLDRRDVIAQAVSVVMANHTNEWHRKHGDPAPAPVDLSDRFDAENIEANMLLLEAEKARWEEFFSTHSIAPTRLIYEEFIGQPCRTLDYIARQLGLNLRTDISPNIGYQKLAGKLSQEWVDRARQYILGVT